MVEFGQWTRIYIWLQENFEGQERSVSVWQQKLIEESRLDSMKAKLLLWIKEWHRNIEIHEKNGK